MRLLASLTAQGEATTGAVRAGQRTEAASLSVAHSDSPEQDVFSKWTHTYDELLHENCKKVSRILDTKFRRNPFRPLRNRFVLAHSPRVGSHLLGEHLLDYGAVVEELFEVPRMLGVSRIQHFVSLEEVCEWQLRKFALNGVFGVSGGVKALVPMVLADEIPEFISEWRFVHLTRDDFVARAVSELIAKQTSAFTSSREPTRMVSDGDYDAGKLRRLIDGTIRINAGWEGAFKTYRVEPYRLTYETLCADPAGEVAKVASFLHLEPGRVKVSRLVPPKLEKQATSLNSRWAERFRTENQAFCASRAAGDLVPHEVSTSGL